VRDLIPEDLDVSALPERIVGGIVPHAGWVFSGRVAATVFAAAAARARPDTVVLFGATHRRMPETAAIFAEGIWETPLGAVEVDSRLAQRILANTSLIRDDPYAHESEHSIEVQVPFVQHLFPDAKILPIMVEPAAEAVEVGRIVARTAEGCDAEVIFVGSTDLTHYGPRYGFAPNGVGESALRWAKEVNDKRMIEIILEMNAEAVVGEAAEHLNACGAGAVAATISACGQLGAERGHLLAHVSSYEVSMALWGQSGSDAVGYAGIVFGCTR